MQQMLEIKKFADENVIDSTMAISQKNHKKVVSIARPILVFLSRFFLIPKNIRTIISHLVEILDVFFPETQQEGSSGPYPIEVS